MSKELIFIAVAGVIALAVFLWFVAFFFVWLRAFLAKAYVSPLTLIAMRLRQVPYSLDSFEFIGRLLKAPYVVLVNKDSPWKTFDDMIKDMKARGLLDDTLIVWTTEFGRMPTFQKGASGRDHNPNGFTTWMTGAGVKPGFSYGATDEFGYKAVENVATIYDFHATILHLLGLNHEQLSFYHNGAERKLTDVHGHVIGDVLV